MYTNLLTLEVLNFKFTIVHTFLLSAKIYQRPNYTSQIPSFIICDLNGDNLKVFKLFAILRIYFEIVVQLCEFIKTLTN